jgi:hypothetical protein
MTETEAKWTERVREWKASGKSYNEFAEGQEFKGSTVRYWACVLRRGAPGERHLASARARPRIQLARVVTSSTMQSATIEIAVGAARVLVRAGFDRTLLRQVVDALGARL